ncbi:MAG: hypothetical protein ACTSQG_00270 [Promethearchaeota archaeon]
MKYIYFKKCDCGRLNLLEISSKIKNIKYQCEDCESVLDLEEQDEIAALKTTLGELLDIKGK